MAVKKEYDMGAWGSDPPPPLIDSAVQAIARILTPPSELLELWQETDDFEAWKNHLEELKQRLQ
ncbi:DUF4259 domain-containing protein [Tumidithrix elongata RA019]|uniref:DUF4259 domain-containing protein n=1 Tax=Tumidithrix elongata BACA0141 TaxID=2716417 RepID=A0AAW9Q154_9CYAN|nr:DUF4259 domain-containing protein [Tumidithrix elongata RA019]